MNDPAPGADGERTFPGRVFHCRPTVLAHRGLGKGIVDGLRENSPESFLAAARRGARWVEVDARRTADGHLVVWHDPVTDDGSFVVDQTADELSRKGVARLEEVLEALPPGVGVDLDLKTALEDALRSATTTTAALLARTARDLAATRPVLVTSFDPAALLTVRGLAPGVPLGLLTWMAFPLRKAIPAAAHLDLQVVAAHWGSFGLGDERLAARHRGIPYAVEIAHRAGVELLAWSPPDPQTAVGLLDAGVDAVCVNGAPAVIEALRTRARRDPERPSPPPQADPGDPAQDAPGPEQAPPAQT